MQLRPLTPEIQVKAQKELNEDPKRLLEDIQHLKDWIAKQPHLRSRTEDQWLATFLRGCKFSLERTKVKLDLYYSLRTTAADLHQLTPKDPKFFQILETGSFLPLPNTASPDSPRVMLYRPGAYNATKVHISEAMAVSYVLQKMLFMKDDNSVVAGVVVILDLAGATLSHLWQMTPLTIKKMVISSQDASPQRMKGIHYLNTPPGFETVFNAIHSFLTEKNKNRSFVHNKNFAALYEHIPQDILPAEYGGKAGPIKDIIDHWKNNIQEFSSWLEEDLKYGTDEEKRPGKPKTAEEMFGVEGSFRKLELD